MDKVKGASIGDLSLPIDDIRAEFEAHSPTQPLVISAPTGSGKSTQIPRWCLAREEYLATQEQRFPKPVLVIEPRRVACQSLAKRVADLEGVSLGTRVGYSVRDDDRTSMKTMIRFVTTGVALRIWRQQRLEEYAAVVIDEFHERSLELDLLLALCQAYSSQALIVMSATFAADRLAKHLQGVHLQGTGKRFNVEVSYYPHGNSAPSRKGLIEALPPLIERACEAVDKDHPNILVFLPGKGEISDTIYHLTHQWHKSDLDHVREVIPLHGGLPLSEQAKVFNESSKQRVILATNVAETSLTVPKVGLVIDSGLVRQTRYDRGRGALSLTEIAHDSAEQRRGRAGRLSAGKCWRMWSQGTTLKPFTIPEIHRESISPLLLASAACKVSFDRLPLLDPPKAQAVSDARTVLEALGAFDDAGLLTSCGDTLFTLGIDLALGRWLIEGQVERVLLDDLLDLVSALSVSKSMFLPGLNPQIYDELRQDGCDATGLIRAMRVPFSQAKRYHLNQRMMYEAHDHRQRLTKALSVKKRQGVDHQTPIKKRALAMALLRADPRSTYVLRLRRRREVWVGLGPEMELGHDTAIELERTLSPRFKVEALFILDQYASVSSSKSASHRITLAMPLQLDWLKHAQLGQERLGEASYKQGQLFVTVERVFAKKILETRMLKPSGQWARQALVTCLLKGQIWPKLISQVEERLERLHLAKELKDRQNKSTTQLKVHESKDVEEWLLNHLEELGFEDIDDLELISEADLLPSELDDNEKMALDKAFPRTLNMSDARYVFHYNVAKRKVIMEQVAGSRRSPPRPEWLPQCGGFEVRLKQGQHDSALRARKHSRF